MRWRVALAVVLLASGALAGCFERNGTLTIDLTVSDEGAIREFRSINLTLSKVEIKARTLNPESFPSEVKKLELVAAARAGTPKTAFQQDIRADRIDRITLTTPPGATFDGILLTGQKVGVVVPGNVLQASTDFELRRGASSTFTMVLEVQRSDTGTGAPAYLIVVDPEASRLH